MLQAEEEEYYESLIVEPKSDAPNKEPADRITCIPKRSTSMLILTKHISNPLQYAANLISIFIAAWELETNT